jgi:hypothetical protein
LTYDDGRNGIDDPRYLGEAGISLEEFEIIFNNGYQ